MAKTATVTSESMINTSAKIRRKYGLREGTKVVFVESGDGITLVPIPPIGELFGIDRQSKDVLIQAVKELEEEHRREARE